MRAPPALFRYVRGSSRSLRSLLFVAGGSAVGRFAPSTPSQRRPRRPQRRARAGARSQGSRTRRRRLSSEARVGTRPESSPTPARRWSRRSLCAPCRGGRFGGRSLRSPTPQRRPRRRRVRARADSLVWCRCSGVAGRGYEQCRTLARRVAPATSSWPSTRAGGSNRTRSARSASA